MDEHTHDHHIDEAEHSHPGVVNPGPKGMRKYLPLIVIFLLIAFMTTLALFFSTSPTIEFGTRVFMGVFFLIFGAFKIVNLRGFAEAYSVYDLVAQRFFSYGYIYPFIELGLGLAYLSNWNMAVLNGITLIVMLVSALGVGKKLLEREVVPCACLGVVFKIPMTNVTLFEDLLMAAMALVMIFI